VAGTAGAAAQFPNHPYFGVVLDKPRFDRNGILDDWKIKGYFGKSKASLNQVRRGKGCWWGSWLGC
jgi:hypothetical protein